MPSDNTEWDASPSFVLTGIALQWGEHPSVFGVCEPEDDPAFMAAYTLCKGNMEAYERYIDKLIANHREEDDD